MTQHLPHRIYHKDLKSFIVSSGFPGSPGDFVVDNALSPTFKLGSINLNYEFSEAFELLSSITKYTDEGYLRSHIKDAGCSRFDNAVVFEYWTAEPHLSASIDIASRLTSLFESVSYYHLGRTALFNECFDDPVLDELSKKSSKFNLLIPDADKSIISEQYSLPIKTTKSLADLKRLRYNDQPLGLYIYSNICDLLKVSQFNPCKIRPLYHSFISIIHPFL